MRARALAAGCERLPDRRSVLDGSREMRELPRRAGQHAVCVRAVRRSARAVARCSSEAARACADAASSRATPANAATARRVAGALSGGGRGPARRTPTSVPGRQVLALRGRQPSARTMICTARSVRPATAAISRSVRLVRS